MVEYGENPTVFSCRFVLFYAGNTQLQSPVRGKPWEGMSFLTEQGFPRTGRVKH